MFWMFFPKTNIVIILEQWQLISLYLKTELIWKNTKKEERTTIFLCFLADDCTSTAVAIHIFHSRFHYSICIDCGALLRSKCILLHVQQSKKLTQTTCNKINDFNKCITYTYCTRYCCVSVHGREPPQFWVTSSYFKWESWTLFLFFLNSLEHHIWQRWEMGPCIFFAHSFFL